MAFTHISKEQRIVRKNGFMVQHIIRQTHIRPRPICKLPKKAISYNLVPRAQATGRIPQSYHQKLLQAPCMCVCMMLTDTMLNAIKAHFIRRNILALLGISVF